MRLPIQYALSFPERLENDFAKTDFKRVKELTFFEPDLEKFKCLQLAYDSLSASGTASCILNAANEVAVEKFLKGNISFNKIPSIIDMALNSIENHRSPDLETIIECDKVTREYVENLT
jgi:1-deoxy-D-xylulose-5-phosphate reductoisomerase